VGVLSRRSHAAKKRRLVLVKKNRRKSTHLKKKDRQTKKELPRSRPVHSQRRGRAKRDTEGRAQKSRDKA
jgi:hypothetical protein